MASTLKALVIGGSGFIGSHVVDRLLEQGARVRVYDRAEEAFRPTPAGIDFRQGDFDDSASLAEALADIDVVFHLLSTSVPATSNLDPVADIRGNLIGTVRLLELMRQAGVRKIVYLSSGGTVYGPPQTDPIAESHPTLPICSYGVVKLAVEKYILMEQHLHGLEPVILRVSNPYGPRQGHGGVQGVIGTFLWRIAGGEPVEIWGDGSVVRDFIHVTDMARLCVQCAESGLTGVFNAGSGTGASIREVVDVISAATKQDIQPNYKPGRGFDVPRAVLDISAIRERLEWHPEISLSEGIKGTWAWVLQQKR